MDPEGKVSLLDPETALGELRQRFRVAFHRRNWNQQALADKASLSRTVVNSVVSDTGNAPVPSRRTVTYLADALDLEVGPLLALRETAAGLPHASNTPSALGPAVDTSPSPPAETANTVHGVVSGTLIQGRNVTIVSRRGTETTPAVDDAAPVGRVTPEDLEVHHAVLPGPDAGGSPFLTPYLIRPHDAVIRDRLAPALEGNASMLVMVTGDSSTGKTRALYEALTDLAPGRALLRPQTPKDLLHLLTSGRVDEGAVLWLNEAQRVFYGPHAPEAATALHHLLTRQSGIVAMGTLWTTPIGRN